MPGIRLMLLPFLSPLPVLITARHHHCTAGSCGEPASCKRGIVYQREVSHLATVSGYHTLVVEASSPDHRGSYYLVVELQCDEASCGC